MIKNVIIINIFVNENYQKQKEKSYWIFEKLLQLF